MFKQTIRGLFLVLLTVFIATSCDSQNKTPYTGLNSQTESCSAGESSTANQNELFKLEGQIISKDDLSEDIKESIYKSEYDTYSKTSMIIKEYALRLYLAKKQNKLKDPKNPPPILDLLNLPKISEKEIKLFFKQNKNRMPPNTSFDKMKGQLVQFLKNQKARKVFTKELAKMESSSIFTSLMPVPVAPKVTFNTEGFPTKGNKNSKIKIVEISDYLCGHCQKAHLITLDIMKKYKEKVSLTQINFALRPAGLSGTYVRGAFCAQKQDELKFWEYHNAAFTTTAVPHVHTDGDVHTENDGNSKESIEKATNLAKKVKLNMAKFTKCLNSSEAIGHIQKTNTMLNAKGINATPVFIINDQKLVKGIYELEEAIKRNI